MLRNYQTLSVIGGVLGITIVFFVYMVLGAIESISNSFGGDLVISDDLSFQIGISILLYIVAIIVPFVIKNTKVLGYLLIILSFTTFVSAGYFGILGFALFIAAGIAAIRYKQNPSTSSAFDLLKERYAKGEIDKEEFENKKRDLE